MDVGGTGETVEVDRARAAKTGQSLMEWADLSMSHPGTPHLSFFRSRVLAREFLGWSTQAGSFWCTKRHSVAPRRQRPLL